MPPTPVLRLNPLFIGEVSSPRPTATGRACRCCVSIPSSSGRSLQRVGVSLAAASSLSASQSPLHRGGLFNSLLFFCFINFILSLNPLFIGEVSSTVQRINGIRPANLSQSPLHRGGLFNCARSSS